jgi:LacI family transcriptional regulator
MVRIIDVANAAGVSPSTVSHVLNGKRPISETTKRRVLDAIEELGYTPNPNAQALKSNRTGIIGFYASDITELFVTRIIRGVEMVARDKDVHIIFASGVEFDGDMESAFELLRRRRVDSVIVSFGVSREDAVLQQSRLDVPLVAINRPAADAGYSVLPDNAYGGRLAARHFAERGVQVPAFIGGPRDRLASAQRLRGFEAELGVTLPPERVFYGDFSYDTGEAGARKLLADLPEIDGLFCANDYIAAGAINAAPAMGREVPSDLKVLGYDDREFAAFWPVPISTITQPLEEMGIASARIVFDLLDGTEPAERHRLLRGEILPRASTSV